MAKDPLEVVCGDLLRYRPGPADQAADTPRGAYTPARTDGNPLREAVDLERRSLGEKLVYGLLKVFELILEFVA